MKGKFSKHKNVKNLPINLRVKGLGVDVELILKIKMIGVLKIGLTSRQSQIFEESIREAKKNDIFGIRLGETKILASLSQQP